MLSFLLFPDHPRTTTPAETDNNDDGRGTMEAVNIGTHNDRGSGVGDGPWILADLEDGMWAASGKSSGHAKAIQHDFVTAMLKVRRYMVVSGSGSR